MRRRRLQFFVSLTAASLLAAAPAHGVVGVSASGDRFAHEIVMVLTRGPEGAGFCSGVVLAPHVILTAAHCVKAARDMRVHFKDAAGAPVFFEVAEVMRHPGYRADALTRRVVSVDMALVRTVAPLPVDFVAAELASGALPAVGDALVLAGFGVANEGAPLSGGTLRAAELKVRAPLSSVLLWSIGAVSAGSGACTGDSGAPVFSGDGRSVVAIVAWTAGQPGQHCGAITQGPLISPQRAWIGLAMQHWAQ